MSLKRSSTLLKSLPAAAAPVPSPPTHPVLVVGGGIGGLVASLSFHRAGIASELILREKSFLSGPRNAALIAGSAVRILDRLGLGPLLRTHGSPITNGQILSSSGQPVVSVDLDRVGTEAWVVPRASLHQFFVDALPPDTVRFGTRLRSLRAGKDGVDVEMQHEASAGDARGWTSRARAGLLVGADGLASTVRAGICKPMLMTSGMCIWHSTARSTDTDAYPPHAFREIWSRYATKGMQRTRFGFTRISADEVAWWAVAPSAGEVFLRPFLPKLLELFDDYPDVVQRLLQSVESEREIHRHQVRHIWPGSTSWIDGASKRVALVGDAGRVGEVGSLHNGCSFAIEDSYMLAHYIAEQGGQWSERLGRALRAYAENRESHDATAKKFTDKFYKLTTTRSPIARYFLGKYVLAETRMTRGRLPDRPRE